MFNFFEKKFTHAWYAREFSRAQVDRSNEEIFRQNYLMATLHGHKVDQWQFKAVCSALDIPPTDEKWENLEGFLVWLRDIKQIPEQLMWAGTDSKIARGRNPYNNPRHCGPVAMLLIMEEEHLLRDVPRWGEKN